MNVFELLICTMEEILSLPASELRADPQIELIENGLIDSLSSVLIITEMEVKTSARIDIKKMTPADFETPLKLAEAIKLQIC